jgi:adenylate cyclase class 2
VGFASRAITLTFDILAEVSGHIKMATTGCLCACGGPCKRMHGNRARLIKPSMPNEIEIKLPIKDVRSLHRTLKLLALIPVYPKTPRIHEANLLFDTPDGGLAKHGQLLRIRIETPASTTKKSKAKAPQRHLLTFKSPPESLAIGTPTRQPNPRGRYKIREESELVITDAGALQKIFEGLGLRGWFRYEKYRTTYKFPVGSKWAHGLLVEVDETPIGTFVELEGPGEAIDRAARELGFSHSDYIQKNYLLLYLEDCKKRGEQPTHMLFKPHT